MLFHLSMWLMTKYPAMSWLNVVRYLSTRVVLSMLTALLISFFISPWFISLLRRKQLGQPIRDDGPETHFQKEGTPTMGGTVILLSLIGSTLLWADLTNHYTAVILGITTLFGLIGFLDDYLKISERSSRGLPGRMKLISQFLIAGIIFYLFFFHANAIPEDVKFRLALPVVDISRYPQFPGWMYLIFVMFVVVGTSNAVNLTDGLDGLAIGPVILNAFVFMIFAYAHGALLYGKPLAEYLKIVHVPGAAELVIYTGAMVGSGIGFLWYNTYPASVFMGDVGSLALGGGIGSLAVLTKNEIILLLVGGIFVLEAVSVMLQVGYFKLSGGKRIFLMSPIHHHFEKKGWPEPKVIVRFWIISFILSLLGLVSLKLH